MLILNNRWNGKSKVDWKWSKSNRKWLLCDAFKKGNFRHVVVYVAWVLFCKWNKNSAIYRKYFIPKRKWLSWCAKTVLNPSLTRHQDVKIVGHLEVITICTIPVFVWKNWMQPAALPTPLNTPLLSKMLPRFFIRKCWFLTYNNVLT